ncbi:MAG: ATP-binding protein [bacterium]
MAAGGATHLPLGERDLKLTFTAAADRHPEQVRFSYRLVGYDALGGRRGAARRLLHPGAPGTYHFEVRAAAAGGFGPAIRTAAIVVPRGCTSRGGFGRWPRCCCWPPPPSSSGPGSPGRASEVALEAVVQERTEQIARQAEALRSLDDLKTRFFAHVSHELRTPLTVVGGFIERLLEAPASADQQAALVAMRRNTRRLQRLTNQILELERGALGGRHVHARPVSLARLAEAVVRSFGSVAEGRDLASQIPPDLVAFVDPEMLESVVTNLVSNAVKFTTPAGRIALRGGQAGERVWLEVEDDGRGIPAADLPHIFDRFYRVRSPELRHGEGSGLGLALVQELVQQQGGLVGITSTVGEGTCVRIELPGSRGQVDDASFGQVAAVEASLLEEPPVPPEQVAGGRPEVLVVDDNADLRAYVGSLLVDRYAVRYCSDGERALARIQAWPPDVVVADVMMPGLDGFELARALGADPETAGIPVLLLTARADADAQVAGLAAGAVDYLGKPFSPDVLCARVDAIFRRTQRLRDSLRRQLALERAGDACPAPAEAPALSPQATDEAIIDHVRAAILVRVDDETLDVPALARVLGMSKATLTRRLASTPYTPAALIRTVRLERAHALLTAGAGNVSDVAYAVGFRASPSSAGASGRGLRRPPSSLLPRATE